MPYIDSLSQNSKDKVIRKILSTKISYGAKRTTDQDSNGIITSSRDVVDLLPLNNFLGRPHLSMHCAITILHSFMGV